MAQQMTHIDGGFAHSISSTFGAVRGFFGSLGSAMVQSKARSFGVEDFHTLHAKSDAELAAMNIKRDDIVHHVFNHLYYS